MEAIKEERKRKRKRMDEQIITAIKERKRLDEDDLIVEILSRLPTKSFVRFKSVCKSWLRLASNPHYRKLLPVPMSGVFYNSFSSSCFQYHSILTDGVDVTDGTLTFLPSVGEIDIVDCCNGLLLCHSDSDPVASYFVCNPTTKKWAPVPFGSRQHAQHPVLAFDPRLSCHHYVLTIRSWRPHYNHYDFEIFSSETGEWMQNRIPIVRLEPDFYTSGAYFNGSYHVFSDGNHISRINISKKLTVDPIDFMLPMPKGATREGRLGKSGGYLYCAWYPQPAVRNGAQLTVWVLQDYENHVWVLKHSVDLKAAIESHRDPEISSLCYQNRTRLDFLAFHPDIEMFFIRVEKKFLSYNWKNGTLTRAFNKKIFPINLQGFKLLFEYSPCLLESF